MADRSRPRDRNEFEIAIICALPIESDAVEALFDEFWEDHTYGKAAGDTNTYTLGRIGHHDVVLAFMPGMGKSHSASVAAAFRSSFEGIKLGLVVGICGGVPQGAEHGEEILLGDVIISTGLVQYDFGRQLSDRVIRKDMLQDNLGRPNMEIRGFLSKLRGLRGRTQLRYNTSTYLRDLCGKEGFEGSRYPGPEEDKLYEATYRHKHQDRTDCVVCVQCKGKDDAVCGVALEASCAELKCDDNRQLTRTRLKQAQSCTTQEEAAESQKPAIHFGLIASGDLVMKSGYHRDMIAAEEGVIAFEMEGAGVWDNFPTVVIKGVCDYADSHKNKKWQRYAAATAASCMKAFLKEWTVSHRLLQGEAGSDPIVRSQLQSLPPGLVSSQQVNHFNGSFNTSGGKAFYGGNFNSGGGAMHF
jgi:nucleoside phosphorylase